MGQEAELTTDQGQVVFIDGSETHGELEARSSDRSLHGGELRIAASGFPSRHDRLMGSQPVGEFRLGQTRAQSSLPYQGRTGHFMNIALML